MPIQLDEKKKRLEKSWLKKSWQVKKRVNFSKVILVFLLFNLINFCFSKASVYRDNQDISNANKTENSDINIADVNKINKVDRAKDANTGIASADKADRAKNSNISIISTNDVKDLYINTISGNRVKILNTSIIDAKKDKWQLTVDK